MTLSAKLNEGNHAKHSPYAVRGACMIGLA